MKKWILIDQKGNVVTFVYDKDIDSRTFIEIVSDEVQKGNAVRFSTLKNLDKIVHDTLKENKKDEEK